MPEAQSTNPPTFDSVWAGFQKLHEVMQESHEGMQEFHEKMNKFHEGMQEFHEKMNELRESQKETDRQLKETDRMMKRHEKSANKKLGSLTNLFGDMTEAMVAPKICKKFNEFGFSFLKAGPNPRYTDETNGISFEVDIMLENSDKAMLIEVKTKLTEERIDKHILRLEKMRKYANLHGDKRIFLGAVAGIVVTDEIRKYALSQGLYFIEYAGETFYITAPNGEPKEW